MLRVVMGVCVAAVLLACTASGADRVCATYTIKHQDLSVNYVSVVGPDELHVARLMVDMHNNQSDGFAFVSGHPNVRGTVWVYGPNSHLAAVVSVAELNNGTFAGRDIEWCA